MSRTKLDEAQIANAALVSEREFRAGWLSQPVRQNLTIDTYDSGTGIVTFTGSAPLAPDKGAEVRAGQYLSVTSGGALGVYLILSLESDSSVAVESLGVTGSGGLSNIFEPPASDNLGISTNGFTVLTAHTRLQDLLAQLDVVLAGLSAAAVVSAALDMLGSTLLAPPLGMAIEVGAPAYEQIGLDTF
jgi:hypothetical protein